MSFIPASLIRKKRDGFSLSKEEIHFFISGYHRGEIPDYQMSALLMAITIRGLEKKEAAFLTESMLKSGEQIVFPKLKYLPVDKHSTGGIGDKTSLLIAPIVASCGVPVPMIAGRGLGHTGGTIDKLESIPGFNVQMDLASFKKQVVDLGCALIGQTSEICPADKKIYALRDVTGTVESIGLICGSILSKKIAEGIQGLVIDIKYGSGAFMKTPEQARELATWLAETAALNNVKTTCYITDMNQPLGRFIGNAIEVLECLCLLKNSSALGFNPQHFNDTRELSLTLSAEMLVLAGRCKDFNEGYVLAKNALDSGVAFDIFQKMVTRQGGNLEKFAFTEPSSWMKITSPTSGYIENYDAEAMGYAAIALGAGRKQTSDTIDHQASIICHKKIGDAVTSGETLFSFTPRTAEQNENANQFLTKSPKISLQKVASPSLILDRIVYDPR
ncbi:thymidine phosphorylase [bacterium]|nr:thymidine phosphorylase [bacterium]